MLYAYGFGAYLTVTTFFLPTFARILKEKNEADRRYEWNRHDTMTTMIASLLWPVVIADYLCRTVARMFKGGK
jgi:hypothetical protein